MRKDNEQVPNCSSGMEWRAIEGTYYDRGDALLSSISDAYERCLSAAAEHREVVLLSGQSGVGKTTLALTLKDRVLNDNGYILTGKFDEVASTNLLTTLSYGPLKEAFTEYCHLVMAAGTATIRSVRASLEVAFSSVELQVLVETFPALNKILRPRKVESAESHRLILKGADAESRFAYICGLFVGIISSQGYPVVLLLDDIHWASDGTLELLKAIATTETRGTKPKLLIICTCCNNENKNFSTDQLRSQWETEDITLTNLEIDGISLLGVHYLLCDLLRFEKTCTPTHLAKAIFSKTEGNMFHVIQVLKELEEEGLGRDLKGRVVWNANGIMSLDRRLSTRGIATMRIERQSANVKIVLQAAACLGCAFPEVCIMEAVLLRSSEIHLAITKCLEVGIFVRGSDSKVLRFSHDKFRQAAYMMIPEKKRDEFHLNVGRRLLHWLSSQDREKHLMLIVDHISRGLPLINDQEEERDLAAVFLRAGKKAARESSFSASAAYLSLGIQLLRSKCWINQYELSLNLYNTAAEVEYYCGNFTRVDELVGEVLASAQSFDDTMLARFTKIYCLGSRGEMPQALKEGFDVLKCLGEHFPVKANTVRRQMELFRCKMALRDLDVAEILNAPVLKDKNKLTAMRLMLIIHPFAFFMGDKSSAWLSARVVRMTLQHGINELSCAGFANLGLWYATQGEVDLAYHYSCLALGIFEKFQAKEWQSRLALAVYAFAFPLKRPLRQSFSHLLEGHRVGLVHGDICFSVLCAFMYCLARLYAGDPTPEVLNAARAFRKNSFQYGQFVTIRFDILIQFCMNLMGQSEDPLVLTGDAMNEQTVVNDFAASNPLLIRALFAWKHFIAVYMNQFDLATHIAKKIESTDAKMVPFTFNTYVFLQALASAVLAKSCPKHKRTALGHLTKLRELAQHVPDNYLHRTYLVEAELAQSAGNYDDALMKFRMSVSLAEKHGYIHEQALACERSGYALQGLGKISEANSHFVKARSLFDKWGAQSKVVQLTNHIIA